MTTAMEVDMSSEFFNLNQDMNVAVSIEPEQ